MNDLSKIIKKKFFGIYLSILEPTSHASKSFDFENKTNDNNEFIFINNKDINILVYNFISFLYIKNINIYIYDDDIYMLDENINLEIIL